MKWLANTADQLCWLWYPDLVALPDETLMRQLAAGNHDALAVIFDRYQRLVLRVAMQVLRDPAEAEDLLQSVFLEILGTAGKFDASKGTLRVWILQYVYHRGFNRRRYVNLRWMSNPLKALLRPRLMAPRNLTLRQGQWRRRARLLGPVLPASSPASRRGH